MHPRKHLDLLDLQLQKEHQAQKSSFFPILAVDYGEKYSGLSISGDGVLALPLEVVATEKLDVRIQEIIRANDILFLVFGLPFSSDNSENHVCDQIRTFAKKLEKTQMQHPCLKHIPEIFFVNERHSSRVITSKKTSGRIDDLAAVNILEYFWQSKKHV